MLNYIISTLEKFKNEDEDYHPECCFGTSTSLYFDYGWNKKEIVLFNSFSRSKEYYSNVDIFQEIKLIIEGIERRPYNLIFNTKPFEIEVEYKINYPRDMGDRIEFRRYNHLLGLESIFRTNERTKEKRGKNK